MRRNVGLEVDACLLDPNAVRERYSKCHDVVCAAASLSLTKTIDIATLEASFAPPSRAEYVSFGKVLEYILHRRRGSQVGN